MKTKLLLAALTLSLFVLLLTGCGNNAVSSGSQNSNSDKTSTVQSQSSSKTDSSSKSSTYYGKNSGSIMDIIKISDLPKAIQDNVQVWYENSIIIEMTQTIYNTNTNEKRTVNLFAKPGVNGYGSLELGENEKYFSFNVTLVSKDDEATVKKYYASKFNKATYMENCYDVPVSWGKGNKYATIQNAESIAYKFADNAYFSDLGYTEENVSTFNQYLKTEGYKTYISLRSEWVP